MRLPEYQISNSTSMWVFRKLLYKQKLQIFFLLLWAGQKIIRWELTKIKTLDVRSISVGQYYIHQILCLDKLFQFINFSAVTFSTTSQNTLHKDIWRTMPILMFRTFHMYVWEFKEHEQPEIQDSRLKKRKNILSIDMYFFEQEAILFLFVINM